MEKMKTMNSRTSRTSTKAQQSPLSTSDCTLRYQLPKYYFSSMSMHYFLRNQQKCWKSLCISMFKKVRNTSLFRSLIWVWSKGQYSLFWAENRPTICSVVHKPTNQQQTGMGKKKTSLVKETTPSYTVSVMWQLVSSAAWRVRRAKMLWCLQCPWHFGLLLLPVS